MLLKNALGSLLLLLTPCLALGQDDEAVTTGPIEVALESVIDEAPERPNSLQYFAWERLNHFGLRVDSQVSIGADRLQRYVERSAERWTEQDEGEPPAAVLRLEGRSESAYDNSEFFGQGQAHNFRGKIEVVLRDGQGEVLETIELEHSWGRLPTNYTKRKVLQEYNGMIYGALLVGILSNEQVQAQVPEDKREELQDWLAEAARRVLEPLEGSNMGESALANYLRGLGFSLEAEHEADEAENSNGE